MKHFHIRINNSICFVQITKEHYNVIRSMDENETNDIKYTFSVSIER